MSAPLVERFAMDWHAYHQRVRDGRAASEGEDECQQIDGERDDPEQRNGRHVAGQVGRGAEHQARRDERQYDPAQT